MKKKESWVFVYKTFPDTTVQTWWMAPARKSEPKKLIWRINQGDLLPWIDSLGLSCLGAAIQRYLGYQFLRKLCWQQRIGGKNMWEEEILETKRPNWALGTNWDEAEKALECSFQWCWLLFFLTDEGRKKERDRQNTWWPMMAICFTQVFSLPNPRNTKVKKFGLAERSLMGLVESDVNRWEDRPDIFHVGKHVDDDEETRINTKNKRERQAPEFGRAWATKIWIKGVGLAKLVWEESVVKWRPMFEMLSRGRVKDTEIERYSLDQKVFVLNSLQGSWSSTGPN